MGGPIGSEYVGTSIPGAVMGPHWPTGPEGRAGRWGRTGWHADRRIGAQTGGGTDGRADRRAVGEKAILVTCQVKLDRSIRNRYERKYDNHVVLSD